MRVLLIVALIIGVNIQGPNCPKLYAQQSQARIERMENRLEVSILPSKRRYRPNEQLKLLVMLMNSGRKEVYILGKLEWGHSASFLFHIIDASGKNKTAGVPG